MRSGMRYFATILAVGAIGTVVSAPVAAAAVAPSPAAAIQQTCTNPGPYVTQCSSGPDTSISVRPNPHVHVPYRILISGER